MSLTLDLQIVSGWPHLPNKVVLRRWAAAGLAGRLEDAELTIRLVDESESAELNRAYRHKEGPTNVLSFPFEAPPGAPATAFIGDLVICAPVVAKEAGEQGKTLEAHWAHMVVHGVLHLLGYEHAEEAEARAMEGVETVILRGLGFPGPYE